MLTTEATAQRQPNPKRENPTILHKDYEKEG